MGVGENGTRLGAGKTRLGGEGPGTEEEGLGLSAAVSLAGGGTLIVCGLALLVGLATARWGLSRRRRTEEEEETTQSCSSGLRSAAPARRGLLGRLLSPAPASPASASSRSVDISLGCPDTFPSGEWRASPSEAGCLTPSSLRAYLPPEAPEATIRTSSAASVSSQSEGSSLLLTTSSRAGPPSTLTSRASLTSADSFTQTPDQTSPVLSPTLSSLTQPVRS